MRQAIHQVKIDRTNAGFPQSLHGPFDLRIRLNSIDRSLDLPIEVLHAKASASQTKLDSGADPFIREDARIELHGKIERSCEVEALAKGADDCPKIICATIFGVPPPK
jgi:hypothetical protein